MRINEYHCDTCMKTSPVTEGWWTVRVATDAVPSITVAPFCKANAQSDGTGHACSRPCAARLIGDFLFTAKITKQKALTASDVAYSSMWRYFLGDMSPRPKPEDEED